MTVLLREADQAHDDQHASHQPNRARDAGPDRMVRHRAYRFRRASY
jgi:hypothetical protein